MNAEITDVATTGHPDFWLAQEVTTDAVIVRVRGELDQTTIPRVDDQLDAAAEILTPSARVVLDLSDISL